MDRDFQQAIATAISVHTCLYIYCNLLLFMLGPTEHKIGNITITLSLP
jgi:hypothetical protein